MKPQKLASALTIAGLDPSGGAGIAADLRAFQAAGAWGCAVLAAITVQSTRGLRAVRPVAPSLLLAQLEELLDDVPVAAIKTGALGSAQNARVVERIAGARPGVPLIVDPVMAPSRARASGARLDGRGALAATRALAARATLLTPNLVEAAVLLGEPAPITARHARDAVVALLAMGPRAVLLKGGHAMGAESVDWLALARSGRVERIARRRLSIPPVHGTGCILASLVAGRLAMTPERARLEDGAILSAVLWARAELERALKAPASVGQGLAVLRCVPTPPSRG